MVSEGHSCGGGRASHVMEHGLGRRALVVAVHGLWDVGSVTVTHRLSSSVACGLFLGQGWSLCLLQ